MKETEYHCSKCKRFLTEEEVAFGRGIQKKETSDIYCWYCHTTKLMKMREALGTETDIPLPTPESFGRPGAKLETKQTTPKKISSDNKTWPDEVARQLEKDFGYNPNEQPDVQQRVPKHMAGEGTITKIAFGEQKYTFISAFGANEDVSLTFKVPKELMEEKLEDAIHLGLTNILRSLMNMLTFAPLHGGIMENILRPPPQNPMGGSMSPGFPSGE